ncbi:MAG: hypothetical protein II826_11200 [Prevotella sp.]|nr:hypothetical protein [Prevotella sp.]MBQ4393659.1 hypothetical protein [Prevotella sp.]
MRYFSMAALTVMGLMMSGCSSDDNFLGDDAQGVSKGNVVTLTTTVGLDEGSESKGTNRALDVDFTEKKATKTFAAGEKMALVYKNTSGTTVKVESDALAEGDIVTGGKSATFTFTLTDPKRSENVTYIYPAAMAKADGTVNYDALASQNGTLATLSSGLDLATYTGAWTDGTSLPAATLDNQLAILALTLKNSTGTSTITSGLTQVTLSDGTNTYTVTPTSSTFGTDVIYVAIRPVTAALSYTATDGTTNYTKTATSREYAASGFYNLGLRMAVPVPSFTVEVKDEVAKKVLFAPGNLQATNNTANSTSGWTWSFAAHQYDYIDNATANTAVGNNVVTTAGTVDLFGWVGNTSSLAAYGINNNKTPADYGDDTSNTLKSDWGVAANAVSLGGYSNWRTLTSAEWTYVFNSRSASTVNGTSNARYAKATVADKAGIILFPDTYTHPSGVTAPASINTANAAFTVNNYDATAWGKMESAGAVFLPAAGYRFGTSVSGVGSYGNYWSSTPHSSSAASALFVYFGASSVLPADDSSRNTGRSVRLVRQVE